MWLRMKRGQSCSMQDLNGELRLVEEKQGLELSDLKSNSFRSHSTREGML